MANEGGEKTEMPTPKKLRDARNKGQVCNSKDIVSTICLIVLFCLIASCGKMLIDDFVELSTYISERIGEDPIKTVSGGVALSAAVILKHSFIYAGVAAPPRYHYATDRVQPAGLLLSRQSPAAQALLLAMPQLKYRLQSL